MHLNNRKKDLFQKDKYVQDCLDSLVARLNAGNSDAADELVDSYYEQIYLLMRRLGHGHQVSEDLTQECFLQAWQHIGQLRSSKALKGWMYRIAVNISKQYFRRYKEKNSIGNTDEIQPIEDCQNKLENYEQLCLLKDALDMLPGKLKETIILHYIQHLTINEAAKAVGVANGTFKSRLNRALKKLRKQLNGK